MEYTDRERQKREARRDARRMRLVILALASGMTVGSVLLFRLMATEEGLLRCVLYGIGGVVVALLALFAWFVLAAAMMAARERGNFFLYDRKSKTSIAPEQLDLPRVKDRLAFCFRAYFGTRRQGAIPPAIRCLLLPYLLLAIMDGTGNGDWERLFSSDKSLIDEMSSSLATLGLEEMARVLQYHRATFRGSFKEGKKALMSMKPLLEERLVGYVREHIAEYEA